MSEQTISSLEDKYPNFNIKSEVLYIQTTSYIISVTRKKNKSTCIILYFLVDVDFNIDYIS